MGIFFPQTGIFFIKDSLSNALNLFIPLLRFLNPFFLCTHLSPIHAPKTGFVGSSTTDTLGWVLLCCRGCAMHCRLAAFLAYVHSMPGATPYLQTQPNVPWEAQWAQVENCCPEH